MSITPWDEMTRGWTEMYDRASRDDEGLVRRPHRSWPTRSVPAAPIRLARADGSTPWRMPPPWPSCGGRGRRSAGRWAAALPGVSAGGGIAAETLGRMTDPLAMSLAGGGQVGDTIRRMTEGPRFADIGAAEHRMAKLMDCGFRCRPQPGLRDASSPAPG